MEKLKEPGTCPDIEEIRTEIDKIDCEIVGLFALRNRFVERIVDFKDDEEGIIAIERKSFVISKVADLARGNGLKPELFEKIYTLLIEDNISREMELLKIRKSKLESF